MLPALKSMHSSPRYNPSIDESDKYIPHIRIVLKVSQNDVFSLTFNEMRQNITSKSVPK